MIVKQFFIILGSLFLGYLLSSLFHIPIPANVLGLVLLFLALCTGIVKIKQVEKISDFIITYLSVFFVVPTVGIMVHFNLIGHQLIKILVPLLVSIFIGLFAAGKVTEIFISLNEKNGGNQNA
ncbi:CidA/LrgA family protein [Anaerovorax odorimutans]|uniref:CidA/LrgA family protein n=1 Tax=Anaerovorax odorimutans TaxID=109327 RepID=UPI00041F16DD|nr:CidA/LrgA family protein [Anaerovorax odorimutans]